MTDRDDTDEWSWRFTSTAEGDLAALERTDRQQIVTKLENICNPPWRDLPDYGERLKNSPYRKVRVEGFRFSITFDRECKETVIARIKRRDGAYTVTIETDICREPSVGDSYGSGTTVSTSTTVTASGAWSWIPLSIVTSDQSEQ